MRASWVAITRFEHLKRFPDDLAGAFGRVGTRERLIHLYAFQSHLWNRALALWIDDNCPDRFGLSGIEGRLRFPKFGLALPEHWHESLVLPAERLDGVEDPGQRALFERVLESMGLGPDVLQLPDVPGFQLKPEARPVIVRPLELRVRPAEQDNEFRGRKMLRLSFGLPRGASATMVLRRLVGPSSGESRRPPRAAASVASEGVPEGAAAGAAGAAGVASNRAMSGTDTGATATAGIAVAVCGSRRIRQGSGRGGGRAGVMAGRRPGWIFGGRGRLGPSGRLPSWRRFRPSGRSRTSRAAPGAARTLAAAIRAVAVVALGAAGAAAVRGGRRGGFRRGGGRRR